jgi:hypothetical protein
MVGKRWKKPSMHESSPLAVSAVRNIGEVRGWLAEDRESASFLSHHRVLCRPRYVLTATDCYLLHSSQHIGVGCYYHFQDEGIIDLGYDMIISETRSSNFRLPYVACTCVVVRK